MEGNPLRSFWDKCVLESPAGVWRIRAWGAPWEERTMPPGKRRTPPQGRVNQKTERRLDVMWGEQAAL